MKKFVVGLILGLAFGALAAGIVLNLYYVDSQNKIVFEKNDDKKDDQETTTTSGSSGKKDDSSKDDVDLGSVSFKKKMIRSYIDKYFLYEDRIDEAAIAESEYAAMLNSLKDPYSVYYTKEEYDSLMETTTGNYCGIGAYVTQDATTGVITIVKPVSDVAPAAKVGLQAGDIVYKVNGKEVTGIDLNLVVADMKGEAGTDVTLTIIKADTGETVDVVITREEVEIVTVDSRMVKEDGHNVGYIQVASFDEVTVNQFQTQFNDLVNDGAEGIVIDLRDNPGGLVDSVTEMLDPLLPEGTIVYMEDKNGTRTDYDSDKECIDIPMAVLINGNSASASEIFAGAVRDYGVATLVGTKTFGKGIAQSIIPLGDGSAIKLTIEQYFIPSGVCIHEVGIEPDVKVELSDEARENYSFENDNQIETGIDEVIKQIESER